MASRWARAVDPHARSYLLDDWPTEDKTAARVGRWKSVRGADRAEGTHVGSRDRTAAIAG